MSVLNKLEVSDIFHSFGDAYREKYGSFMQANQYSAMRSIELCRTETLGGHKDKCDQCGEIRISYNSCRNRNCPKCQSLPAERWIIDRMADILPTHYFHVVFTVPAELNDVLYSNQRKGYKLFFKLASESLLELSQLKKYVGAKIGVIGIMHTWGQKLNFHPHIHFLVTGGGLSENGDRWISSRKKFFIPKKVISKRFKVKFLKYLEDEFPKSNFRVEESLKSENGLSEFIQKLSRKKWVVYCKPPVSNPENVIKYFGRYTHRVAISNRRLKKIEGGRVYFNWKDYSDESKTKTMSLDAIEFIRKFLLHVLPHKFVKIRYYGLYGNRNRKSNIKLCKSLLQAEGTKQNIAIPMNKKSWSELLFDLKGVDINRCPFCHKGRMQFKETIFPNHNTSPPNNVAVA